MLAALRHARVVALLLGLGAATTRAEEGGVAFEGTNAPLADVLARAKDGDRLVMAEVFTQVCSWCRALEQRTFSEPVVAKALVGTVCVRYDAEVGPGLVLADRFAVRTYPTVLFLDAAGTEVDRLVGFLPPDRFTKEVARIRADEGTLRALRRAHERDPGSAKAAVAYARRLVVSGDLAGARAQLDRALAAEACDPAVRVAARLGLAEAALAARDEARALEVLATLTAQDPDEPAACAAWVLRVRLLARAERTDEAIEVVARARARVVAPADVAALEALAYGLHRQRTQRSLLAWGDAAERADDADQLIAAVRAAVEERVAVGSAVRWAQRAAALTDRSADALEALARAQRAAGSPRSARETVGEAMGRGPSGETLERLKALRAAIEAEVAAAEGGSAGGSRDVPR